MTGSPQPPPGSPVPYGLDGLDGLDGVNVQSSNGRSSADATVALVHADGLQEHPVLPLVDEGGNWRVCP
ncbi:hypothetical protein [Geodermatophilus chilensis]|uniref:hypothetical protein n=1 Tax=Geodermatophilus chilensis TaxID=2035835 RepID=UPI000C2624E6|nr:hypothetical protein [Geodermatophilus chilensis]